MVTSRPRRFALVAMSIILMGLGFPARADSRRVPTFEAA
jgi:hypothetical protein